MNTAEQVGPEAVLKWVRDAMELDRAPEAMGRARLTMTYIAPDGTERVTDVPMLDLSRDHAVATIQQTREFYREDYGPYSGVATRPVPVDDWYSVLIHAPVRPPDGESAWWTETVTDPVLQFLDRIDKRDDDDEDLISDWESSGYVIGRLIELRKEETGWPTPPK